MSQSFYFCTVLAEITDHNNTAVQLYKVQLLRAAARYPGGRGGQGRNVRNFRPESKFQISECMQIMRACTSYDKCSLKFQALAEISGAHR